MKIVLHYSFMTPSLQRVQVWHVVVGCTTVHINTDIIRVCAGFLLGKRRMQRHTNVRECAAAYAVASAETAHPGNHQEVIAIVGV